MSSLLSAASCRKPPPAAPPPPAVTVAQPIRRAVTDHLDLTGSVQAINSVQLVARVAGYLEKVLFQDGQMVKKGQLLFLIQQNTYQEAIKQAEAQIALQEAQLEYAGKQLERYSQLTREKATPEEQAENWRFQRDSARSNLKAAEAARELARLNLGYTEVAAPFDGRIDRRLVDPGNLVGANGSTTLAVISQIDPLYVYFTVIDRDLARLQKALKAAPAKMQEKDWPISVGLADEEGFPRKGQLDFASVSLTPTTGTLLLRGVLPNRDGQVLPGLFARVRVPLEERDALLVPPEAIGHDQQGSYVLVVNRENLVEHRVVQTGAKFENLQAIDEGLQEYEWIVVKGIQKAAPGRPVSPQRQELSDRFPFKGRG